MQDSECIIAVNKNETAPIFEVASYGIAGDLFKVTPMLIESSRPSKPPSKCKPPRRHSRRGSFFMGSVDEHCGA